MLSWLLEVDGSRKFLKLLLIEKPKTNQRSAPNTSEHETPNNTRRTKWECHTQSHPKNKSVRKTKGHIGIPWIECNLMVNDLNCWSLSSIVLLSKKGSVFPFKSLVFVLTLPMSLVQYLLFLGEKSFRLSKYIYQKLGSVNLCEPEGFQWNPHTTVHVIVPGK